MQPPNPEVDHIKIEEWVSGESGGAFYATI
jgi:hypothetical protein